MLPGARLGLHLIGRNALSLCQEAVRRRLPVWQIDLPDPLDPDDRDRFDALRERQPIPLVIRLPVLREGVIRDADALCEQLAENIQEAASWGCDLMVLPLGVLPRRPELIAQVRCALGAVQRPDLALEPLYPEHYGGSLSDLRALLGTKPDGFGVCLNSLWLLRQGALADDRAFAAWSDAWERQIGWERVRLLKLNDWFHGRPVATGNGELGVRGIRLLRQHPHLCRALWLTEAPPRLYLECLEGLRDSN